MSDTLLAGFLATLDVVVFERLPNAVFMQVTPSPDWFAEAFGTASAGQPITLSQAFPFLDEFFAEAEPYWAGGQPGVVRSGAFAARTASGEVLLRAAAGSADRRHLLAVERLIGLADPREVMQVAREKELLQEQTLKRLSNLRAPVDALARAARYLQGEDLTPAQHQAVETVRQASEQVLTVMQTAPPALAGPGGAHSRPRT